MNIFLRLFKDRKDLWGKTYPFVFTTIFLILGAILIIQHEFWSDEAYTWLLGAVSSSLKEFIANMKVNAGHPYLWTTILYFVSHFITRNVESMKIIHLAISTTSVFLLLKYAPLNKILKIMLAFSYFLFYEYSIISRNYALGVLLIIIFCVLYKNKYKNIIPLAIVLFLMGQVNIYSFVISIVLFLTLLFEFILDRKYIRENIRKVCIIILVVIVIAEILLVYWQLGSQIPAGSTDSSVFSIFIKTTEEYVGKIQHISNGIISAFMPIPQFKLTFWGSNLILSFLSRHNIIYTYMLSLLLLIIPIFILKRRAVFLYIIGSIGIFFIPLFIHLASLRHIGNLFILFIACIWISNINKEERYLINFKGGINKIIQAIFIILVLVPALIGSLVAFYGDYKYPFTMGKSAAKYIEDNFDLDDIVIIGYPGGRTQIISVYLDKDIYYPQFGEFRQLITVDERIGIDFDNRMLFEIADQFFRSGKPVILAIVSRVFHELDSEITRNYEFEEVELDKKAFILPLDNYRMFLFSKDVIFKYPTELLYEIDFTDFSDFWKDFERCKLDIKDNDVYIEVYGDDPHFESNFPIDCGENESILIMIKIYSFKKEKIQVYYKSRGGEYSERDSVVHSIDKGMNEVFLRIPYIENLGEIRLDPVRNKNDCIIEKIEIYSYKY